MAWLKNHTKQKPDQPIAAKTLRTMAETCDWMTRIQADPPLSIMSVAGGPLLRLGGWLFSIYVGVVASPGPITARVTTTPGTGPVNIQTWNGSDLGDLLDESSNPITVTAYSISSTTGGIPAGTYVIMVRICGAYWIVTADCGN